MSDRDKAALVIIGAILAASWGIAAALAQLGGAA